MDRRDAPSSQRGRRRWPVVVALVAGLAVPALTSAVAGSPVAAQTDQEAAERAAREIQDARNRANAAADAYFQAQSDLDLLADDLGRLELANDELRAKVERLRRGVESLAVSRFVASGASGIPLLTGIQAPQDQVQAEVFVDVLTNTGAEALDEFEAAQGELAESEAEIERQRAAIEDQQVAFIQLQQQAEDEVVRLREIEEERLQDEAVQAALEAQVAAERARLEEQARREAEAAARAIPDPGAGLPAPTTTVVATDDVAADIPAGDGGADATSTAPGDGDAGGGGGDTVPATTAAPTNSGASGGTSGGRTGTGGIGSNPRPIDTGSGYVDTIICPMPGSAFGDTWGAPRSGGRRHEGVDMIAPRGIPIYAVVSGVVTFKQNKLGGNAVSLVGDNGNRYYYGHLDRYEGSSRRVVQGEVIGYNGDTGNAIYSTPHLHFEIRPGGGLTVNPYPSVRAAGC